MSNRRVLGACPVCGSPMQVTGLHCPDCHTSLTGTFDLCKFCRLNDEQQRFVEVFIAARGNIKEVERVLGISYPTVRSRLDGIVETLGYVVQGSRDKEDEVFEPVVRREVLAALDRGEISAEEAIRRLRSQNRASDS
ncbi:MAG: DUF2089 domain-containing protein [Firmicutes bacterium]|nr:DUF2089 domain-containing protein [Bacillota bacterium]